MGLMNFARATRTLPVIVAVVVFALVLGLMSATIEDSGSLVLVLGMGLVGLVVIVGVWKLNGLVSTLMFGAALLVSMIAIRAGSEVTAADVLLGAALGPALILASRRPAEEQRRPFGRHWHLPVLLLVGTLVFGGLIGSFSADNQNLSLAELGRFAASSAVVVVLLWLWRPGRRRLEALCWFLLIGATINAGLGLVLEKFGGRAMGLSGHPNHYALACVLAAGIALGLAFSAPGRASRVISVGCLTLLGVGVIVSGSRAALLGLAVALAAFMVTTKSWRFVALGLVVCVGVLVAINTNLLSVGELNAVNRIRGDQSSYLADQERLEAARQTLDVIAAHPLTGNGFESAKFAHSIYLQLLASAGLLGVAFGVGLIVMAIRALKHAAKRNDLLTLGLACSYLGYLAAGTFSNILWDRYVWLHLAVLMTLVASSPRPMATGAPAAGPARAAVGSGRAGVP